MKKLLFVLPIFVTLACTQKQMPVSECFNSLGVRETSVEFNSELSDSINLPNCRTIVYFYNTGCSVCIADFGTFMQNVADYAFDSLIVVASDAYDFILPEYYLNKADLTLPANTRIVFDPHDNITDKMLETYGYQDVFLLEQKRILMYYHTQGFIRNEELGYCLDANVFKQTVN